MWTLADVAEWLTVDLSGLATDDPRQHQALGKGRGKGQAQDDAHRDIDDPHALGLDAASPVFVGAVANRTACPPALKAVFARSAGVGGVAVHASPAADLATCRYRARRVRSGHCGAVTVQVNTAPQVFIDFQRWVVETGQTAARSSIRRPGHSPVQVNGVRLEADWVPADLLFETATERRWVTVTLNCRVSAARGLPLARRLAVAALAA